MKTSDFDYHLPSERIAQCSVEPRDHSKLMFLDKHSGAVEHKQFFEITDHLGKGDVLVMNDTKVFRARLRGRVGEKEIEVFLLRARGENVWDVMLRPGKLVDVGGEIVVGEMKGEAIEKADVVRVRFDRSAEEVVLYANEVGEIPIPPYVSEQPSELEQYQTVYAQETGSVAAPTAGFHFTDELLGEIRMKGVEIVFVTLHVGVGTFRPVKTETLEEHEMHSEFVSVSAQAAERIDLAKQQGRRVIAIGTTTVRTLEGVAKEWLTFPHHGEEMSATVLPGTGFEGDVNLFIKPGFEFQVVDALITNFHLPKSTLLALVSALAGRENVLRAYGEAIKEKYRFYSFGDAMFIR